MPPDRTIDRREWLRRTGAGVATLALGAALPGCAPEPSSEPPSPGEGILSPISRPTVRPLPPPLGNRPNIILIVADDLGWGDISLDPASLTPALAEMGRAGLTFTDAYVSAPLCSPSRAGLLSGRYPQRFGHEFNPSPALRCHSQHLGLPETVTILPELLRQLGYATGAVGKWHLGSQDTFHPLCRGFDEFFGFLHSSSLYLLGGVRPGVESMFTPDATTLPEERDAFQAIYRGLKPVVEGEYLTQAFTREALSFVDHHAHEPFFLFLSYNAPHTPLQVPDPYFERTPSSLSRPRRIMTGMVNAMDEGIGALRQHLAERGLTERTLLVFVSDNGCAAYTDACSPSLYRGGKFMLFEGGIRVPMLMCWPGQLQARRLIQAPVSLMDLLPTLCGLAGAGLPPSLPVDGLDLVPLLTGTNPVLSREALFWRNGENAAVRQGRHKLMRLGRDHLLLFDLDRDPGERVNRIASRPLIATRLLDRLNEWESTLVRPLWPGSRGGPYYLDAMGLGQGRFYTWA